MGQENMSAKEQNKRFNVQNTGNEKVSYVNISFYILLVIVIICLIPYYSAIIDIYLTAAQAETGRDIYYCVFALLLSIAVMVGGFTTRNGVIKIFGLALTTFFLVYPMKGYFGNNSVFKKTLNDYEFVNLKIIRDTSCSQSTKFQQQIADQLIAQYGEEGFDVEVVAKPLDENATYKEKLKCMPSSTTLAYTLKYKDFYNVEREIIFIDNKSFDDLLRVASYEIVYDKIGEFLKNHQGQRKVSFKLYILQNKSSFIEMTRQELVKEGIIMEYPANVSLANYNMDKRIVLSIKMSDLSKREEAHDIIDKLTDISEYPLNIIISYGKSTEYYMQGKYYEINSEKEFIDLLSKRI